MKGRSSDSEFLTHDKQTRASLWWGESLMSNYWGYFTWSMQQYRKKKTDAGELRIKKGEMHLTPTELADDLAYINFFTPDYCFTVAGENGTGSKYIRPGRGDEDSTTLGELNRRRVYPDIWVPVDTLAKATYSTVLADLGQTETPNILNNETALEYFTANFTTVHKYLSTDRFGPEHVPFDAKRSSSEPLRVVPSVITTPYTCQVPQYKPMGELVLSIIIADLVLLQAAWQLFKAWVWTVTNSYDTAEQGHTFPNPLSVDSTLHTSDSGIRASMRRYNSQRVPDAPGRPASSDIVLQPSDNIPLTTLVGQEHGPPVSQHAADATTSPGHGP
ncbi:hypothetical protein J4E93_004713 [Alternaria ventricosa]|uniref:uncharacterized protein n=1 Tax=Alternaria ventricosa TaxID=1187951 RepID=UPI0020C23AB3|nr:uncharacterized protein J4E93_004713 [Alternaria ventricosa]KAI4648301.1 hypothetical protein J4E93_004713 [Alternaria ventricosa]